MIQWCICCHSTWETEHDNIEPFCSDQCKKAYDEWSSKPIEFIEKPLKENRPQGFIIKEGFTHNKTK